jgi:hypothetical protein
LRDDLIELNPPTNESDRSVRRAVVFLSKPMHMKIKLKQLNMEVNFIRMER